MKSAQNATVYKELIMKRLLLIFLVLIPVSAFAGKKEKTVSSDRIATVISNCRRIEGVELVKLGPIATAALKGIVRLSSIDDPDAREALTLMNGIHGVTVMDYDSCSNADKERINGRLEKALSGSDMLMEASDSENKMRLYGVMDKKTDKVRNFVLFSPSDCALICIFGSISMDAVAKLASND